MSFPRKAFFGGLILFILAGGSLVPLIAFGALPPVESGVSVTVEFEGGVPSEEPLPVGVFPYPFLPPPLGNLVLQGFGPPESFLTINKDNRVAATARLDKKGTFEVTFTGISAKTYEIGLFIEDREGNISQTITLSSIPIFKDGTTKIENIFIPPTLVIDTPRIGEGDKIILHGFTAPKATVIIFFTPRDIFKKTESTNKGYFTLVFGANELRKGDYKVNARSQLVTGLLSGFSKVLDLKVITGIPGVPPEEFPPGVPPEAPPELPEEMFLKVDLNGDGKVDLVDLSILLYNWGAPKDPRADFNEDGIVDLVDFSIMMFYWTG